MPFKVTKYRSYFLLSFITIFTYWTLSFNVFSLKNDAISYFLPWRYHISESIQNGHFPFWSPYLYTGLPLHADIQSGVWNPVVLLISLFTKYNMSVLQWETLLYIIIGGIGFLKLGRFFKFDEVTNISISSSYMLSGFIIDSNSFIPWICSAGYIPYVFLYFLQINKAPKLNNALKLSLSLFLLFTAGYPSFFIISCYILVFLFFLQIGFYYKYKSQELIINYIGILLTTVIVTLILCSPALLSYIDFFNYYERGKEISLAKAQSNPFCIENTISYIIPNASYKLKTQNDISSRNAYIGIIPLLFIIYSFRSKWNRSQKIILILTVLSLVFSLGAATPLRSWLYYVLPFMNSFRHPGTVRLFTTIGLLLLSGFGLKHYFENPKSTCLFKSTIAFLIILILITLINFFNINSIKIPVDSFSSVTSLKKGVKSFIDYSSIQIWIFVEGIAQVFILFWLLIILRRNTPSPYFFSFINIVNICIFAWLAMPFTLASQYTSSQVNNFLSSFPQGYPIKLVRTNVVNKIDDKSSIHLFGYKDFYNKRISIQDHIITPTINSAYCTLLGDTLLRQKVSPHPFVSLENYAGNKMNLEMFAPNYFKLSIHLQKPTYLNITQQQNHNWHVFVNGISQNIESWNVAFFKVLIPAGISTVKIIYRPKTIIVAALASLITLLCILLFIIKNYWLD